ncbi:hypothetical protein MNV49_005461 [Pseudohyphozyma bogoriensis]|nr:hypothetical protein MNV49_005461 [Pseudohyphozyma bogoriensis]
MTWNAGQQVRSPAGGDDGQDDVDQQEAQSQQPDGDGPGGQTAGNGAGVVGAGVADSGVSSNKVRNNVAQGDPSDNTQDQFPQAATLPQAPEGAGETPIGNQGLDNGASDQGASAAAAGGVDGTTVGNATTESQDPSVSGTPDVAKDGSDEVDDQPSAVPTDVPSPPTGDTSSPSSVPGNAGAGPAPPYGDADAMPSSGNGAQAGVPTVPEDGAPAPADAAGLGEEQSAQGLQDGAPTSGAGGDDDGPIDKDADGTGVGLAEWMLLVEVLASTTCRPDQQAMRARLEKEQSDKRRLLLKIKIRWIAIRPAQAAKKTRLRIRQRQAVYQGKTTSLNPAWAELASTVSRTRTAQLQAPQRILNSLQILKVELEITFSKTTPEAQVVWVRVEELRTTTLLRIKDKAAGTRTSRDAPYDSDDDRMDTPYGQGDTPYDSDYEDDRDGPYDSDGDYQQDTPPGTPSEEYAPVPVPYRDDDENDYRSRELAEDNFGFEPRPLTPPDQYQTGEIPKTKKTGSRGLSLLPLTPTIETLTKKTGDHGLLHLLPVPTIESSWLFLPVTEGGDPHFPGRPLTPPGGASRSGGRSLAEGDDPHFSGRPLTPPQAHHPASSASAGGAMPHYGRRPLTPPGRAGSARGLNVDKHDPAKAALRQDHAKNDRALKESKKAYRKNPTPENLKALREAEAKAKGSHEEVGKHLQEAKQERHKELQAAKAAYAADPSEENHRKFENARHRYAAAQRELTDHAHESHKNAASAFHDDPSEENHARLKAAKEATAAHHQKAKDELDATHHENLEELRAAQKAFKRDPSPANRQRLDRAEKAANSSKDHIIKHHDQVAKHHRDMSSSHHNALFKSRQHVHEARGAVSAAETRLAAAKKSGNPKEIEDAEKALQEAKSRHQQAEQTHRRVSDAASDHHAELKSHEEKANGDYSSLHQRIKELNEKKRRSGLNEEEKAELKASKHKLQVAEHQRTRTRSTSRHSSIRQIHDIETELHRDNLPPGERRELTAQLHRLKAEEKEKALSSSAEENVGTAKHRLALAETHLARLQADKSPANPAKHAEAVRKAEERVSKEKSRLALHEGVQRHSEALNGVREAEKKLREIEALPADSPHKKTQVDQAKAALTKAQEAEKAANKPGDAKHHMWLKQHQAVHANRGLEHAERTGSSEEIQAARERGDAKHHGHQEARQQHHQSQLDMLARLRSKQRSGATLTPKEAKLLAHLEKKEGSLLQKEAVASHGSHVARGVADGHRLDKHLKTLDTVQSAREALAEAKKLPPSDPTRAEKIATAKENLSRLKKEASESKFHKGSSHQVAAGNHEIQLARAHLEKLEQAHPADQAAVEKARRRLEKLEHHQNITVHQAHKESLRQLEKKEAAGVPLTEEEKGELEALREKKGEVHSKALDSKIHLAQLRLDKAKQRQRSGHGGTPESRQRAVVQAESDLEHLKRRKLSKAAQEHLRKQEPGSEAAKAAQKDADKLHRECMNKKSSLDNHAERRETAAALRRKITHLEGIKHPTKQDREELKEARAQYDEAQQALRKSQQSRDRRNDEDAVEVQRRLLHARQALQQAEQTHTPAHEQREKRAAVKKLERELEEVESIKSKHGHEDAYDKLHHLDTIPASERGEAHQRDVKHAQAGLKDAHKQHYLNSRRLEQSAKEDYLKNLHRRGPRDPATIAAKAKLDKIKQLTNSYENASYRGNDKLSREKIQRDKTGHRQDLKLKVIHSKRRLREVQEAYDHETDPKRKAVLKAELDDWKRRHEKRSAKLGAAEATHEREVAADHVKHARKEHAAKTKDVDGRIARLKNELTVEEREGRVEDAEKTKKEIESLKREKEAHGEEVKRAEGRLGEARKKEYHHLTSVKIHHTRNAAQAKTILDRVRADPHHTPEQLKAAEDQYAKDVKRVKQSTTEADAAARQVDNVEEAHKASMMTLKSAQTLVHEKRQHLAQVHQLPTGAPGKKAKIVEAERELKVAKEELKRVEKREHGKSGKHGKHEDGKDDHVKEMEAARLAKQKKEKEDEEEKKRQRAASVHAARLGTAQASHAAAVEKHRKAEEAHRLAVERNDERSHEKKQELEKARREKEEREREVEAAREAKKKHWVEEQRRKEAAGEEKKRKKKQVDEATRRARQAADAKAVAEKAQRWKAQEEHLRLKKQAAEAKSEKEREEAEERRKASAKRMQEEAERRRVEKEQDDQRKAAERKRKEEHQQKEKGEAKARQAAKQQRRLKERAARRAQREREQKEKEEHNREKALADQRKREEQHQRKLREQAMRPKGHVGAPPPVPGRAVKVPKTRVRMSSSHARPKSRRTKHVRSLPHVMHERKQEDSSCVVS